MKGTESIMAYLRDRIPRNQEEDEATATPGGVTQPWSNRIDQFWPKKIKNDATACFICFCVLTGLLKSWQRNYYIRFSIFF